MGTISEEELLGVRVLTRRPEVDATPIRTAEPPPRRPLQCQPAPTTQARRLHKRDILTVLAVAAAVWLAVALAGDGLRFSGSAPDAVRSTSATVVADRDPIASLPRIAPTTDREMRPEARARELGTKGKGGGRQDSTPSGADEGGEQQPPLAEATLPGGGTVKVEQPATPELPATDDLLPATPTLPLP